MSPVFSGNFLVASFFKRHLVEKLRHPSVSGRDVKEKGLLQVQTEQRSGRVSLVWSSLLGNVFSFLLMFSILGWSFVFCGLSESHPIGSCFLSKSYS